jgi:competence protein ComEC
MIGIFLFSEKLQKWITGRRFWKNWKGKSFKVRLRQWLASGISVTLSAMFFTTPLVAYYFGWVRLIGVLTNLLTLWAVTWIFYGIAAVCLLSLFWHQAAVLLAWLISWLIRYVLTVAKLLASIPLAAVYTKSIPILVWLVLCYLLVIRLFFKPRPRISLTISGVVAGLCMALLLSWCLPLFDDCRMTVLDVGQGQSIILQAQGRTFLVDCGGSQDQQAAEEASETLLSMGIYRLDGLILTHYDGDHAGGIDPLLARVPADTVWLPHQSDDPGLQQQILQASGPRGVMVSQDQKISWGSASLDIYVPQAAYSDNERSLCVLLRTEKCAILITGDLGITGENRLVLEKNIPELTALVAGHPGSAYSTGEGLLIATRPEHVYISVGKDNPYGHPSQAVLDRLEQYGCEIHRTDLDGTLVFRR